jgi:hypothetical protein
MTDASIGPIKISIAHLQDKNNKFSSDKEIKEIGNLLNPGKVVESESFSVMLENYLIKQLQGLNRWDEIFWVDTSPDLIDNEDPSHKGWYLLSFKEPNFGVRYSELPVEAKCLSRNPGELFEMDYTIENQIETNFPFATPTSTEYPEINYVTTMLDSDADFNAGSIDTGLIVTGGTVQVNVSQRSTAKFPGAVDQVASDGADDYAWDSSLLYRAMANDSNYVYLNFPGSGWSYFCRGKSFGFGIPSNAAITGLEIRSEHKQTCSTSGQKHWYDMKLYVGGGSIVHRAGPTTSQGDIYWVIGGNGSSCGFNWSYMTPSNINSMMLGFATSGYSSAAYGYLDYLYAIAYWRYSSGNYTTKTIPIYAAGYSWDKIVVSHNIPSGCSIKYDIITAADNLVLIADATGPEIDISSLDPVNIKLRAKMNGNGSTSPAVNSIQAIQHGSVE